MQSYLIILAISIFSLTFNPLMNASNEPIHKINFDLEQISPEGLVGPPDGKRAISYEFCVPKNEQYLAEVKAIAPNLQIYPNSPGRIRCNSQQYLCIGDTHYPKWREILLKLAELEYIEKINQFFGE